MIHVAAERAAEWVLAAFAYWELSCPKDTDEVTKSLGPYGVSPLQIVAFDHLVASLVPLCRPSTEVGLGRGQQRLITALTELELGSLHVADPFSKGASCALSVDPSRVSLPTEVGTCLPELWVPDHLKWVLSRPSDLVLPEDAWPSPLPVPCHMISPENERVLVSRMLKIGMGVLVPEAQVPRRPDGRPLLAGWFAVPHKEGSDRLILDRRPQNSTERRVHSGAWPLGPQLTHLFLRPDHHIYGSACDLKSYYFQLRWNNPSRNCVGRVLRGEDFPDFGGQPGCSYRFGLTVAGMGNLNACDIAQFTHEGVLR